MNIESGSPASHAKSGVSQSSVPDPKAARQEDSKSQLRRPEAQQAGGASRKLGDYRVVSSSAVAAQKQPVLEALLPALPAKGEALDIEAVRSRLDAAKWTSAPGATLSPREAATARTMAVFECITDQADASDGSRRALTPDEQMTLLLAYAQSRLERAMYDDELTPLAFALSSFLHDKGLMSPPSDVLKRRLDEWRAGRMQLREAAFIVITGVDADTCLYSVDSSDRLRPRNEAEKVLSKLHRDLQDRCVATNLSGSFTATVRDILAKTADENLPPAPHLAYVLTAALSPSGYDWTTLHGCVLGLFAGLSTPSADASTLNFTPHRAKYLRETVDALRTDLRAMDGKKDAKQDKQGPGAAESWLDSALVRVDSEYPKRVVVSPTTADTEGDSAMD